MAFSALDILINSMFLFDSCCRLFGLLIRISIEKAFHREYTVFDLMMHSGFLDIIVTCLCFGLGLTEIGLWFRLIRLFLITAAVLELFPQIDVLMVCALSNLLLAYLNFNCLLTVVVL